MGHGRFLVFSCCAGRRGAGADGDGSDSIIPMVGASGAIAGVMALPGAYPRSRIVTLLPIFSSFNSSRCPRSSFWHLVHPPVRERHRLDCERDGGERRAAWRSGRTSPDRVAGVSGVLVFRRPNVRASNGGTRSSVDLEQQIQRAVERRSDSSGGGSGSSPLARWPAASSASPKSVCAETRSGGFAASAARNARSASGCPCAASRDGQGRTAPWSRTDRRRRRACRLPRA